MAETPAKRTNSEKDDNSPAGKRQRIHKGEGTLEKDSKSISLVVENTTTSTATTAAEATQQKQEQSQQHPRCHSGSLFVGSLHPRVADVHLRKLFEPYGTIQRVHRARHGSAGNEPAGMPRSYAFVEFTSVESAQLAMERIHGRVLLGKALVVRPARERDGNKTVGGSRDDKVDGSSSNHTERQKRSVTKEKSDIELKIAAVKRALEQKKKR